MKEEVKVFSFLKVFSNINHSMTQSSPKGHRLVMALSE